MKKLFYYLIALSFIFTISCDKDSVETESLNIDSKNTLIDKSKGKPKPSCAVDYNFYGDIAIDPSTGFNTFLFTWDFSNALIACNIELSIEFMSTDYLYCNGYPGQNNSDFVQDFPLATIDSNGIAKAYFNPIGSGINDKIFMYRTVITGTACNGTTTCITNGSWQGPLCSYMF